MTRFEIDTKRFFCDAMDGEVIVMDAVSGRLFLLEQAASLVWERIASGETREVIVSSIHSQYGHLEQMAVEAFLTRLIELELVTEASFDDENACPKSNDGSWPSVLGEFLITQYDDMTNIITMDPIHDIDPKRGWPFGDQD